MEPKSPAAKEAIVNLYEGEAIGSYRGERLYHASLAPAEYERLLVTNAYVVQAHVAEDPFCGDHTVWLATYDAGITR